MTITEIRDKTKIATFLRRKRALNAYPLGDLDERYWPDIQWFAIEENGDILEIALLYFGMKPPILIAIENHNFAHLSLLLAGIINRLPESLYAHLSQGQLKTLQSSYTAKSHGLHHIMELQNYAAFEALDTQGVFRVSENDFEAMQALFDQAYPGHWFEGRMLDFGPYFAIKDGTGRLLSAGGVHVYSEEFSVATLGNIVTLPTQRGQGHASKISAYLCQELAKDVKTIGLNVHADNQAAIHIYEKLGFKRIANYEEMTLQKS